MSGARLSEIGEVIVEVAPVGVERVLGGAALGGEHVEEEAGVAGAAHEDEGGRLVGTGTLISRGSGSTRVAKANMAAKPRPARMATTRRNRMSVGT
jgi:hypothetical protein